MDLGQVLDLTDRLAAPTSTAPREQMRAHFVTTSRYEWMFRDAVHRLGCGPPSRGLAGVMMACHRVLAAFWNSAASQTREDVGGACLNHRPAD